MGTFSGSSFFGLDELHLIARGIGKHIYELITVDLDIKNNTHYFYTKSDNTKSSEGYPFYIPKANLRKIGETIAKSRQYIPTSFQGSFDNLIAKTDGTRAVDWLDFLLYIVPTLVVPYLSNRVVQKALLALVKGCALALQWNLTDELINEMERQVYIKFDYYHLKSKRTFNCRHFNTWHSYLFQQVNQKKKLSRSVFRPVQHYLIHIPFIIRQLGPLRAYSTRSMERAIGVFSKLINSKREGGKNASNIIERLAIQNYLNCILNLEELIDVIKPKPYAETSYINHPSDLVGVQLWEPFFRVILNNQSTVEGIEGRTLIKALKKFYLRSGIGSIDLANNTIILAARFWNDCTVYSSCMYRRLKKETSRGNQYVMFYCSDTA